MSTSIAMAQRRSSMEKNSTSLRRTPEAETAAIMAHALPE